MMLTTSGRKLKWTTCQQNNNNIISSELYYSFFENRKRVTVDFLCIGKINWAFKRGVVLYHQSAIRDA